MPTTPQRARARKIARAPQGDNKKAARVLLVAKDLELAALPYVVGHLKGEADVVKYVSWEELVKALSKYSIVSELTILGHGGPGSLLFKRGGGYDRTTLEDAVKYYGTRKSLTRPQVNQIHLQSCNIGLDPAPLIDFAKVFKSKKIIAWNHFYFFMVVTFDVPPNANADALRKALINQQDYLPPDVRLEDFIKPGKHQILVEWFRVHDIEDRLPPAATGPAERNPARKPFKRLATAQDRLVRTAEDVKELSAELAKWDFNDPAKTLHRIIIDTTGFSSDGVNKGH